MVSTHLEQDCCDGMKAMTKSIEHRRSREQREFNEATYADGRISDQTYLIGTFQNFITSDGNKFETMVIPISVAGYVQVNVYIRGVLITPQFRRREFRRIAKRVESRQGKIPGFLFYRDEESQTILKDCFCF
jgi:hypothetical protein